MRKGAILYFTKREFSSVVEDVASEIFLETSTKTLSHFIVRISKNLCPLAISLWLWEHYSNSMDLCYTGMNETPA